MKEFTETCLRTLKNSGDEVTLKLERRAIIKRFLKEVDTDDIGVQIDASSLQISPSFKRDFVLVLKPDRATEVNSLPGNVGFYAHLENNEWHKFVLSGTNATFTREDAGQQERYFLSLSNYTYKVLPIKGGAYFNFSDAQNVGNYLVEGDEIVVDDQEFFVGSVGSASPPPPIAYTEVTGSGTQCGNGTTEPTEQACQEISLLIGLNFSLLHSYNFTGCALIHTPDLF